MVRAGNVQELNQKANRAMDGISSWMRENKLELAPGKTKVVVFKGPRKREGIEIRVEGMAIPTSKDATYLGIVLDDRGTFGPHVRYCTAKAERKIAALGRLLPNIGGLSECKRRVLLEVVHSTILYGSSIWAGVLRFARCKAILVKTQRKMLLRVASAYRTVSAAALQVVTGNPPMPLLIEERGVLENTPLDDRVPGYRQEIRRSTIEKWQRVWDGTTDVAAWTKRLIPDLGSWNACSQRRLSYEMTQFLTGHGSYRTYSRRIGKEPTSTCVDVLPQVGGGKDAVLGSDGSSRRRPPIDKEDDCDDSGVEGRRRFYQGDNEEQGGRKKDQAAEGLED